MNNPTGSSTKCHSIANFWDSNRKRIWLLNFFLKSLCLLGRDTKHIPQLQQYCKVWRNLTVLEMPPVQALKLEHDKKGFEYRKEQLVAIILSWLCFGCTPTNNTCTGDWLGYIHKITLFSMKSGWFPGYFWAGQIITSSWRYNPFTTELRQFAFSFKALSSSTITLDYFNNIKQL